MKLHTYKTMPPHEIHHEFKNNSWRGFFYATLIFMAITAFIAAPKGGAENTELAVVPGAVTLFFASLGALRFRQYRLQNNWILRVTPSGLLVNLRSHHHYFFPDHTPCVLELDREEIAAIGKTQVSRTIPTSHSEAREHHSYIDVYLHPGDLRDLQHAIRQERRIALEYPNRKIAPHFTVQVVEPDCIRLLWEWIEPRENAALALFSKSYPLAPDRKEKRPKWDDLDAEGRRHFIRELWEGGNVKDTVRLIQAEHNLTPRQARGWIREHLEPMG
ncbi:MAG: hypothetical protein HYV27_19205 [Candidatus Hydrogenedentes bacterium]|nr:hypothetical protein [Candidatus Hydrogenedentota bacterium]